ncbi:MAG: ABC transporter ATP-binding protein [Candidatus Rokuibacteriota bacterium]
MLDVQALEVAYGASLIVQGASLRVGDGQVVAVLGRNGVGKTTLLRGITGLTPARAGRVVLNGEDVTRLPAHAIARRGVRLVPQGRRLFPSLDVREHLVVGARRPSDSPATTPPSDSSISRGGPTPPSDSSISRGGLTPPSDSPGGRGREWDVARVLALFPRLAERLHHRGGKLSGGEQAMVACGRALTGNPDILLLDEPSEGLAPLLVRELGRVLAELKRGGASILLVEQNLPFALRVADHVYLLSKGRTVHECTPEALRADDALKAQYLGV